jgi:hypothetical protein
MKKDGISFKAKLANHHVKVGMLGRPCVNVERIIAHSNHLETLMRCTWL